VFVDDLEIHLAHAREKGATIVQDIESHGFTSYVAVDLEGRHWRFCPSSPDAATVSRRHWPEASTPRQRTRQRSHPTGSRGEEGVEIVFIIEETVVGTELNALLRREQTEALLELLAAHRSRVQIAPTPATM
jgi:hypothetical protein